MNERSSVEFQLAESTESGQPLADRPLVESENNTVISTQLADNIEGLTAGDATPRSGSGAGSVPGLTKNLSPEAQALQAELFGPSNGDDVRTQPIRFGSLQIYEKIGSGGMGAVFRAVDTELARSVALKVLHPNVAADQALVARFRNEARACAQLNHDNVARVYYAGDYEGIPFIAYEYAPGLTIKQLILDRGRLSPAETVNYAIQATLALNHIDAARITHRDIKPSNIILTENGRIKIVDLGLARRETEDSIADLTVAGTTLGTFDYLAPEQARNASSADIRSDIYSLGCTLYHMLTGEPPYPDGNAWQKVMDHHGKNVPSPRTKNREVPREMAAMITRMMATDPEARYQAPGQLLADLIHLASVMGLRSVPAEGIVWRRVPVRKVRDLSGSMFLAGAVGAICLTALLMHFLPSAATPSDISTSVERWISPVVVRDSDSTSQSSVPDVAGAAADPVPAGTSTSDPVNVSNRQTPSTRESAAVSAAGDQSSPMDSEVTDTSEEVREGDVASREGSPSVTSSQPNEPAVGDNAVKDGFLRRRRDGTEERFSSLSRAWADAESGDIIVLDFDGPAPGPGYPLPRLKSQETPRIVLRNARDRKPVLVFDGDTRPNASSNPTRFCDLSNNLQLEVTGVHFQVNVNSQITSDDWSLFEFRGANQIRMKGCTVDVRNAQDRSVTLFRLKDSAGAMPGTEDLLVDLEGVAIRGDCDIVTVQAQLDGTISARNCGIAIDGSLIRNLGSAEMVAQGNLNVQLTHCTGVFGRPAISMQDSELLDDAPAERIVPSLDVTSRSCVFASAVSDGTLVEIRGNLYREELKELLKWDGVSNFYNNFAVFWRIESAMSDRETVETDFTSWVEGWNRMSNAQETSAVVFANDIWQQPQIAARWSPNGLSALSINAFELNPVFFSIDGASRYRLEKDDRTPGVSAYDLAPFPSPKVRSESAPAGISSPTADVSG